MQNARSGVETPKEGEREKEGGREGEREGEKEGEREGAMPGLPPPPPRSFPRAPESGRIGERKRGRLHLTDESFRATASSLLRLMKEEGSSPTYPFDLELIHVRLEFWRTSLLAAGPLEQRTL